MSDDNIEIIYDEEVLKDFERLPLDVAQLAWKRAVQRATIDAHRRAIEHRPALDKRGAAVKRKFLTPSQREGEAPRGVISARGYVPVDTGRLRGSIQWKFIPDRAVFGDVGSVFSNVEYAPEMESMFGFLSATQEEINRSLDDIMADALDRAKAGL